MVLWKQAHTQANMQHVNTDISTHTQITLLCIHIYTFNWLHLSRLLSQKKGKEQILEMNIQIIQRLCIVISGMKMHKNKQLARNQIKQHISLMKRVNSFWNISLTREYPAIIIYDFIPFLSICYFREGFISSPVCQLRCSKCYRWIWMKF